MIQRINRPKRPLVPTVRRNSRKNKRDNYPSQSGHGGFVNPIAGAGTSLDKNSLSFFSPTRILSKNFNETLYVESWAAGKFIDIPVDDMFLKWREFEDMDNRDIELVERAENSLEVKSHLSNALKSSRLYGTGLFIIITRDTTPDKPLDVRRMIPGDLANIISVDRFDANIVSKETNIYSRNYGKPILYNITLKAGGSFVVHHSRVIRFDGKKPLTSNSWVSYDQDWGVASIVPVITEIFQDSNVSKGVAHLVNEASIATQKIDGFEEALQGGGDGEMSLQERMENTTYLRSIYRTLFMDAEDTFERHDVTFAGLPDLLDKNASRLAAAADIPETRFLSKSLSGLNSTGDGEARNYAQKVQSDQMNTLPEPLQRIDSVLKAHLGLNENIKYKFPSILDISEADKVDVALKKSQLIVPLIQSGVIDEDEAREIINGDEILGNYDALLDPIGSVDEFKKSLENITGA